MGTTRTGAELFVESLERYGVERVFGNPGTTELPLVSALGESDLEYVLGLHEDVAVGMASGYASTRRYHAHDDPDVTPVGVANLHIAPGLAHGLGNLYAARVAGAPVVVTAGNHSTDFRHEEPILSGDLVDLAENFTKWSAEVLDVSALPTMLRRAFRVALTPPTGPVFLALPLDVTTAETDADPEPLGPIPNAGRGDPGQVERAADLLAAADSPAMVVGDGVARSEGGVDAAVELAEAAGLRVFGEILASEVDFPTEHEQWATFIPPDEGLASTLMETDTLVFAGCSTNTTLTRHERALVDPGTTCLHVSDDAWQVGKNQPADAAVLGDPGLVLSALADAVRDRLDDAVRRERVEGARAVRESLADTVASMGRAEGPDDPRPSKAELVDELLAAAPDAYLVDEGVTAKYPLLARWPLEEAGLISNKGGGLGYGLSAAVGAAVAERDRDDPRDVVGFVGDGSYLYYPQAVYSAARHDLDLTVVVSDNRNYRILKDNAADLLGDDAAESLVGVDFDPAVDLVKNAESHGATATQVERTEEVEPAIADAVATDGPSVVDVLVRD
ncbi:thiamine pyrophosphate-binding protein [Halostella litorea]|uniref:thiamine pyrophosphate-binding protein n=1 Tax=Halostella litorea TaxID=2528831 RepID=UPI001091AB6B|nr:thiamine pyrophosphate-binding protein [Halostella litorea]